MNFQIKFLLEKRNIKGAWLPIFFISIVSFLLFAGSLMAQTPDEGNSVSIPEVPNPPRLFNDYAGIVSSEEASSIENTLNSYNDSTSVQIAVVVVNTVGQYDIADYAQQLAQKWQIGNKGKNNGVLLVLAMNDRKSRIEVGYGLEGVITDIQTAHIQDNVLRPLMKQKQYSTAILSTVEAIYLAAKGEYKATAPVKFKVKNSWIGIAIFAVLFIFIVILAARGGGTGGNSGGMGDLILPAILLSQAGSRNSGSSWGSFSGGSGGFGGFGGGSFGGGGSSGSW